ncbi:MAG: prepilin-type N-terminal cleavage/methylation domain-containing protein [Deltaproteobacteria bacterium]|nr:prepilin-type N-terminal cleavage/methylation domain-containing protein [Deltaproteobacteria bacterium]
MLNGMNRRNQRGFTLIEIIAVLVILTILVALAMPKYFSIQDEARKKAAQTALAAGGKPGITAYTDPDASVKAVANTERTIAGDSKAPAAGMERHPGH